MIRMPALEPLCLSLNPSSSVYELCDPGQAIEACPCLSFPVYIFRWFIRQGYARETEPVVYVCIYVKRCILRNGLIRAGCLAR